MNRTERNLLLEFYKESAQLELELYGGTATTPARVATPTNSDEIRLHPALVETIRTFIILIVTGAGPAIAFDAMDDSDTETEDGRVSPPVLFEDGPSTELQKLSLHLVFTIKAVRLLRATPTATINDVMDGILTMCKCGSRVEWVPYTSTGILNGMTLP